MAREAIRYRVAGAAGLVVLLGVFAVFVGVYAQVFTSFTTLTLRTDRSGLLTDVGARVELHGVQVGRVSHVDTDGRSAVLTLAMDPAYAAQLPADVTAKLVPTTVFGAKFVSLDVPAQASARRLRDGDVIDATGVTPEVNDVFEQLMSVLTTVQPAKLSDTLGAVASALRGRGDQLGNAMIEADDYLEQINPSLPALGDDLRRGSDVLATYNTVTPGFVSTLDNLSITSDTLVSEQDALRNFLVHTSLAAGDATRLTDGVAGPLTAALRLLLPTGDVLARYSPELTCTIQGVKQLNDLITPVFGQLQSGLHLVTAFIPGGPAYQNPRDLPVVGADNGPDCHGLPLLDSDEIPAPHVNYDVGVRPFPGSDDQLALRPPLAVQLFGPLAQEVTGR